MAKKNFWGLIILIVTVTGCATPLRYLIGAEKAVRIPQIVAHLEPSLQNNRIFVSGKIILENPTESDLLLDKILLTVNDGSKKIISKIELNWENPQIKSRGQIEAPVNFFLPLKILNQQTIQINLKTAVIYKVLSVRIPIESEIAVFHLAPLKNSLTGPLQVTMYTKVNSDISGNAIVKYRFEVSNPFNVDLLLKEGEFKIYTQLKEIGAASLADTLLGSKQANRIQGEFIVKNLFRDVLVYEFIRGHAIKAALTGKLSLPETDLFIPFKAEAIQEVDFSLLPNIKKEK